MSFLANISVSLGLFLSSIFGFITHSQNSSPATPNITTQTIPVSPPATSAVQTTGPVKVPEPTQPTAHIPLPTTTATAPANPTTAVSASASIDQSSLTSSAGGSVTITGTATGVKNIGIGAYQNGLLASDGITGPYPVVSGKWSVTLPNLSAGTYTINVFNGDSSGSKKLTSGKLILTAASASSISASIKAAVIAGADNDRVILATQNAAQIRKIFAVTIPNTASASDAEIVQFATYEASDLATDAELNAPTTQWTQRSSTIIDVTVTRAGTEHGFTFVYANGQWQ